MISSAKLCENLIGLHALEREKLFVAKLPKYFISSSMQIISDFHKDAALLPGEPGSYEWWYFDAMDRATGYSLVAIFYRGNPFSKRYIRQIEQYEEGNAGKEESSPAIFPAVSISVYKDSKPVFYSFTEYSGRESQFSKETPSVTIGEHSLDAKIKDDKIVYELRLKEDLPSGDRIEAELTFSGNKTGIDKFPDEATGNGPGHLWNLVQPKAEVRGFLELFLGSEKTHEVDFTGLGYHDHNMGIEPMKDEFKDWYWGRFHFRNVTLVYYVMNRQDTQQYHGWLIGDGEEAEIEEFEDIRLLDKSFSLFGLDTARKLILKNENTKVVVQQSVCLDNGPFYRRFRSEAFLSKQGEGIQKATGFSEYIYPERIYWRLLWPLIDMRIRYREEETHWVQKSARLYRWTWGGGVEF